MALPSKKFSKVVMIIFLGLIVIGFTVPGILYLNPTQASPGSAEPRICQTDSDCYLMCNEQPVNVLCTQNLCQQNSCTETSPYPYSTQPVRFQLAIVLNDTPISLVNSSNPKDNFVQFSSQGIESFSPQLPLRSILEKAKVKLNPECLEISSQRYCQNDQQKTQFLINEKESYTYDTYVPQEGDQIKITYS